MLIALSGAVLSAAQSTAQAPVSPPGQPARDRPGVTSPVERGIIRGRVTDFATGEGVPRALVQVSGATTLATLTGPDGSFELRELAAGQYAIYASRRGYLDDDPIRRATSPIEVAPNGGRAEVNIPLMRAGVIGGQVTDEFGEPVAGVQVRVGRSFYVNGRRQLLSMAHMGLEQQTDDEGRFRVGNLRPGRYFVWTQPFSDVPDEGLVGEAPQSYLKTFAPGVRDVDSASAIELGPGDRNLAVNVALTRGRSVNVSVMATGADGAPLANVVVSLDTFELGFGFSSFGGGNSAKMTDKQGHFAIPNVAPGQYALSVRSVQGRGQPRGSHSRFETRISPESWSARTSRRSR
jgi:protocatechuate 3,4-dioxygenase beta subunit